MNDEDYTPIWPRRRVHSTRVLDARRHTNLASSTVTPSLKGPHGVTKFAPTLTAALKRRRITHAEFARLLGVSRARLSNWTCGKNEPSLCHAHRIAQVLGLDLADMIKGTVTERDID